MLDRTDSNLDAVISLSQMLSALNGINAMLKTTILRSGQLYFLQNSPIFSSKQLVSITLKLACLQVPQQQPSPRGALLFMGGVGGNLELIHACLLSFSRKDSYFLRNLVSVEVGLNTNFQFTFRRKLMLSQFSKLTSGCLTMVRHLIISSLSIFSPKLKFHQHVLSVYYMQNTAQLDIQS